MSTTDRPAAGNLRSAASPVNERTATFVLIVASLAQFMVVLDNAVVYVAIPKMTGSLSLSASGQQWVVNAYALTFGGLLLLGGRLSDLYGQRRMFVIGTTLFTLSSLICGFAQSQLMIELARGAQGIGGAIMAPTSLSLITTAFTDPAKRAKAIGAWATVTAAGSSAGVLAGGVLTTAISWRWVFFVNVPVGAFITAIALTKVSLPRVQLDRRLDIPGAALGTIGLGLIVYAIIGTDTRGWTSPVTLALLGGGVLALLAFLTVESRLARDPVLPLGLFADRRRSVANVLFATAGALIFFMYFDISIHLQRVDHEGALATGLSFLPVTVATMVTAVNGRRLLEHLGMRRQLLLGSALTTVGFAWISQLGVHAEYWTHLGLPMILMGLGFGLTFVPQTVAATAGVPAEHAGAASGLVNTSRQLGGAIGLAALTTVATSGLGAHPSLRAIAGGDRTALWVCAALAATAMLLSLLTGPRRTREQAGGVSLPARPS